MARALAIMILAAMLVAGVAVARRAYAAAAGDPVTAKHQRLLA